ncbi:hypothetical protein [Clostridium putrefaciens]|nr:hypothetical protein [Clostridium putrefaciens]
MWIIFGGLFGEIGWIILVLIFCITIIGILFEK